MIVGFMDFKEKVESGVAGIWDIEQGDVLSRKALEANILKNGKKGLTVDVGTVIREKMISGSVRQLSFSLS